MENNFHTVLETRFGIARDRRPDTIYSIEGIRLSTDEGAAELISRYAPLIKALEPGAAAAYFTCKLGTLCAGIHYGMARNVAWDFAPARWSVDLLVDEATQKTGVLFRFQEWNERPGPPVDTEREKWRVDVAAPLYGAVVRPIVEAVSRVAAIDSGHLWRLVPMYLRYYMEQAVAEEPENVPLKLAYEDDWRWLTKGLGGETFGRQANPLDVTFRTVAMPVADGQPDREVPMKTACCMYYRTEGGDYCYTCPRLKAEEREVRKQALRAKLQKR